MTLPRILSELSGGTDFVPADGKAGPGPLMRPGPCFSVCQFRFSTFSR